MSGNLLHSNEFKTVPAVVQNFIRTKIAIEGCSEKTATEYLLDLRTFFRYLVATEKDLPLTGDEFRSTDISSVDLAYVLRLSRDDVIDFLSYAATDRENEKPSRARKLSALKSFFHYISTLDSRYADFDPTKNIKSPKRDQTLPKYLTAEESVSLLDSIAQDENSRSRKRDFAIVTLFLNCGMRLSELVGIDLTDIDPSLRSLRVFGKGGKERIIYLNDACRDALSAYFEIRAQEHPKEADANALFISERENRISVKTVQHIVYKYLEKAGLAQKGMSVHKLRHTAATLMYQTGQVDVRVLKDILGHAQLNTTQIYTHLSNRDMEAAMRKNPLASVTLSGESRKNAEEEKDLEGAE